MERQERIDLLIEKLGSVFEYNDPVDWYDLECYGHMDLCNHSDMSSDGFKRFAKRFKPIKDFFGSSVKMVYDEREGTDKDTKVTVYYFEEFDIYLCISGWYSSWEGTEYDIDTICEVRPYQKLITVYLTDKEKEKEDELFTYSDIPQDFLNDEEFESSF